MERPRLISVMPMNKIKKSERANQVGQKKKEALRHMRFHLSGDHEAKNQVSSQKKSEKNRDNNRKCNATVYE